ncbi:MAG: hypothetical protein ACLQVY_30700 [Limisphaerales bacterium]
MSISAIIVQIVISLATVALYHFLVSRKSQPGPAVAPPVILAPPPVVVAPPPPIAPLVTVAPVAPVVPVVSVVPPVKSAPVMESTPPEIVAVIAAAIAVVLGRPHRVLSVQQGPAQPAVNVWAMEGRVEQFMSHRVR